MDDGSGDNSLQLLREAQRAHPDVITVVKLTRNFGSMAAIQAGLAAARGDCVGMIAADLQDPPELFLDMVGAWENGSQGGVRRAQLTGKSPPRRNFSRIRTTR